MAVALDTSGPQVTNGLGKPLQASGRRLCSVSPTEGVRNGIGAEKVAANVNVKKMLPERWSVPHLNRSRDLSLSKSPTDPSPWGAS